MNAEAILLAAGQGRRFQGALESACKVLIEVGGQCLLDRHIDALLEHGVSHVTVVVGFEGHRIEERVRSKHAGRPVSLLWNDRWKEGSLYSLYCARALLESKPTSLFMDADVLYESKLIATLTRDTHPNALLFDADFMDEEMRVGLRGGLAVQLGKKIQPKDYQGMGRGPGFYRVDREGGLALSRVLEQMVGQGLAHLEYEDALNRLFLTHPFYPVPVAGAPWTEIDNLVDLERAKSEIWPKIIDRNV